MKRGLRCLGEHRDERARGAVVPQSVCTSSLCARGTLHCTLMSFIRIANRLNSECIHALWFSSCTGPYPLGMSNWRKTVPSQTSCTRVFVREPYGVSQLALSLAVPPQCMLGADSVRPVLRSNAAPLLPSHVARIFSASACIIESIISCLASLVSHSHHFGGPHSPFCCVHYYCNAMSGLEVVSAVASIGQLIDLGVKVINRMKEFRDKTNSLPKAFQHIEKELPAFVEILRNTKAANDANQHNETGRKALDPLIQECYVQIKTINTLLQKMLPDSTDSGVVRGWKAVASFRYDDRVTEAESVIRKYLNTMNHQGLAPARRLDVPRMHTLFMVDYHSPRTKDYEPASSWLVQHI